MCGTWLPKLYLYLVIPGLTQYVIGFAFFMMMTGGMDPPTSELLLSLYLLVAHHDDDDVLNM